MRRWDNSGSYSPCIYLDSHNGLHMRLSLKYQGRDKTAPSWKTTLSNALKCHWNATSWPSVHWDTTGWLGKYQHSALEHYWPNFDNLSLHWNTTRKTYFKLFHTGMSLEKLKQPTQSQAHLFKQSSIHASLKWQDGNWTDFCRFSLYL